MKEFSRNGKSTDSNQHQQTTTAPVQRKKNTGLPGNAKDSLIQRSLIDQAKDKSATASSGQSDSRKSMPSAIQAKMENSFGTDFSNVNIHEGNSATSMNALAYTQGNDIHFAPGQYSPESKSGQELLGHELTHVVQQRQGNIAPTTQLKGIGINDDKGLEKEADDAGKLASEGKVANINGSAQGTQLKPGDKNETAAVVDKSWPSSIPWPTQILGPRLNFPSGYHTQILSYLISLENTKNRIARDWSANMDEKDFKPSELLLSIALDIVGNGFAAAFKILASHALKDLAGELTTELITQTVHKTIEDNLDSARGGVEGMINSKDYSSDDLHTSASKGSSDTQAKNLKQYYLSSMSALFIKERDNKNLRVTSVLEPSELFLAMMMKTYKSAYELLDSNNSSMQQSLTVGYMKLLDSLYLQGKASDYEGKTDKEKLQNMYSNSDTINEVYEREGNMIILDNEVMGGLGYYNSLKVPSKYRGIVSGSINKTVAKTLNGVVIDDLPISLGFRFWGYSKNFMDGLGKVWFTRRPDKTISVDLDESWQSDSGGGFDTGREWLARFYLQTDKNLSQQEIEDNVAHGAAKLYNIIKSSKVGDVQNMDL